MMGIENIFNAAQVLADWDLDPHGAIGLNFLNELCIDRRFERAAKLEVVVRFRCPAEGCVTVYADNLKCSQILGLRP